MSANGIIEFSNNVLSHMNAIPKLLDDWQFEDLANNNVNGYFKNPVANVTSDIMSVCGTLVSLLSEVPATNTTAVQGSTGAITNLFNNINISSANVAGFNGTEFIEHTNRISGVTPVGASPSSTGRDTALLPHYDTAMATGQLMMYLTYQSEGIQNNSPIMNNFTSIVIEEDLNSLLSNISSYYTTISNSITVTGGGTDALTDPFVRTSNLTFDVVTDMFINNIQPINITLAKKRNNDEIYYNTSRQVSQDFNELRKFNNMGATANNLIQNYIGSDKLLTRLNS
jgi:hypothetical protein